MFLQTPTSVAMTPDGFNGMKYKGSYSLVLAKRKGFVRLAHATGAAIVPVLGVGEPDVPLGPGTSMSLYLKVVLPVRATPIRVVFGKPVAVEEGESVEDTHMRYVDALLALGKQHGVPLEIAE